MIIVKEMPVGQGFPINQKLAGLVPMAVPSEQESLTLSIAENGLQDPVILWRGEIVDGRCRQKACITLGIPVRAKDLDDDRQEDDIATYVKTVNTRRNLTVAQKIMVASKESCKTGSRSVGDIAKSWGVSRAILTMANFISRKRPEFVEPLFNGLTVPIVDAKGNDTVTNKISAIHAHIRREEEEVTEEDTHDWCANDHIRTQAGKDWFYDFVKETGTTNVKVMMELAARANTKFVNSNEN